MSLIGNIRRSEIKEGVKIVSGVWNYIKARSVARLSINTDRSCMNGA